MDFGLENLFQGLIVVQASLLVLILNLRHSLANRLLCGFLGNMALHMATLLAADAKLQLPMDLSFAFGFLYGPFFYLYGRALIYRDFVWQPKMGLHFVPALIAAILVTAQVPVGSLGILVMLHYPTYLLMAWLSTVRFHKVLVHTHSGDASIRMTWFQSTCFFFMFVTFFDLINYGAITMSLVEQDQLYAFLMASIFLFVSNFVYHGLKHPQIFAGISQEEEAIGQDATQTQVAASPLDDALTTHINALALLMDDDKPWLDSSLSLQQLANMLELSPRQLSQLINGHHQQNFSDFVNTYRIEEAKRLLRNSKEPVLNIMFDVGFNSKSSFNAAFKKKTGMTPTQYRKAEKT